MNNRNCPNCGAPYDIDRVKCPYCGTLTLDLAGLNLQDHVPIFIRYKMNDNTYITQKAIPHLETMELKNNTADICDNKGYVINRVITSKTLSTMLRFDAVPIPDTGELFLVTTED